MHGTASVGAVYDRGYRPYDGPRLSRFGILRALWVASIRRALGLRRSWRQKLLPWVLLAIVTVPATIQVGVAYLTRNRPEINFQFISYREYVGVSTALLLFVAITAPDVICPDRRHRVLPLILSRPLTGTGYALAKLAAIFSIVFAFGLLPQMVLFLGQMLVNTKGSMAYASAHLDVLWKVPVAVCGLALYYSAIGVAVSSLSTRRVAAAAIFLGLMLVSGAVTGIVGEAHNGEPRHTMVAVGNLAGLPLHLRDIVFLGHINPDSPLGGVAGAGPAVLGAYAFVVVVAVGVTLMRYREAV
jgi:ABC-2 type transport system permease protein